MTTMSTAQYELDAFEAAAAIASGDLSVWDLNKALVNRVDALEPSLNAFVYWTLNPGSPTRRSWTRKPGQAGSAAPFTASPS